MNYIDKYSKYKNKYLQLKKNIQLGGNEKIELWNQIFNDKNEIQKFGSTRQKRALNVEI